MNHHSRADDVRIESDESGFELHVDTEDGDTFVFNIHHLAWDLAGQAERTICEWRREGEAVRSEVARARSSEISEYSDEGYPPTDPKHSNYHSLHSELWDNRDKETA